MTTEQTLVSRLSRELNLSTASAQALFEKIRARARRKLTDGGRLKVRDNSKQALEDRLLRGNPASNFDLVDGQGRIVSRHADKELAAIVRRLVILEIDRRAGRSWTTLSVVDES